MKKHPTHRRALSSIFAVLILIAIAVMGGNVVYLYTSGYLSGMTGVTVTGKETVAIEAIVVLDADNTITLHCRSLQGSTVIIEDAILKNAGGQTLEVLTLIPTVTLSANMMTVVTCVFDTDLVDRMTYSVVLVSQLGNQFPSILFTA